MHLHDRVREHGGDQLGKSLQPINDGRAESSCTWPALRSFITRSQNLDAFVCSVHAVDMSLWSVARYGLVAYQALVKAAAHYTAGRLRLTTPDDDRIRHHRNEVRRNRQW